jgi:hypothetical protein
MNFGDEFIFLRAYEGQSYRCFCFENTGSIYYNAVCGINR